jgi:cytochrome oxidase Cu insertion factor (SCO1/SenC/PrrC family)
MSAVDSDQPLGLTVHSLPTVAEATGASAQRTRSGRWKMLVVMLVCAAPVLASYFMYYVVRPEGRRVFGELIQPQRPLPDLVATDLQDKPVNLRGLKGQWLLVSVADGACDAACESNLYLQRQLRETLGKEKERVDRVWLVTGKTPIAAALLPAHP